MRVVLTAPSLEREFGGPTAKARRLRHELVVLGHDVRLIGAGAREPGVVGLRVASRYHGTPVPWISSATRSLIRGADVVHVMGYRDPVSTVACLTARRAGVPYLVEPVGMHRRRLRSIRLKLAFDRVVGAALVERATSVIATSALEARELVEDGVDPGSIVVRPNGIDVEGLLPLPARGSFRREHGVPDQVPLVLSLGRITRKKGLTTFAEAISRLPGVWGAIVGPDDGDGTLEELRGAVSRLGASGVVIVPGGLWGPEKAAALADADAFCLPSATENFGNAPAEAAAVGLPVAISRECGVAEYLDPGSTVLVDHDDAGSVARGVDASIRPAAREAAREAAASLRRSLSWSRLAAEQASIYERSIAPRPSRPAKVLLTVASLRPSFGGPAIQAEPFRHALQERGVTVRVAGCDADGQTAIDLGRRGSFHGTPVPSRVAPLLRAVRRSDLVHVMGFRDPVGTIAGLRASVPLVVEPMGMHRRRVRSMRIKTVFDRTLGTLVMDRATVVVATSTIERDELVRDGVPDRKIVIRPNGVEVDPPLHRGAFRAELGVPDGAPLVVFLGRISMKKGLIDLAAAVAGMTGCRLAVVGPDDGDGTLGDLRAAAARWGMQDRTFIDPDGRWGPGRAVVLADADAFCLPSLTENFGNAAAEAATLGIPVVVSDRCGVVDSLAADAHRVVPVGDVPALRDALAWALRPDAKARAEAAAADVRARLSWPAVADRQVAIYERVLR